MVARRLLLLFAKRSRLILFIFWLNGSEERASEFDTSLKCLDEISKGNMSDCASKFFAVIDRLGHAPRTSCIADPIDRNCLFRL